MSVSVVKCCTCDMWETRDASSVSDDYICKKCTQLQLLTDRKDRLEQRLDALRSMKVAERVIDRCFRDVMTSKVQADRWVTARRGRQSVQESPVTVPLSNKYTVLDTVGGGMTYQGITAASARAVAPWLALLLRREGQRAREQ